LSGGGNYLDLPSEPFQGLTVSTFECWVKWDTFAGNQHVFEFDAAKRVKVGNGWNQPDLEFRAAAPELTTRTTAQPAGVGPAGFANASPVEFEKIEAEAKSIESSDSITQKGALILNRWFHLAVVFDQNATLLY